MATCENKKLGRYLRSRVLRFTCDVSPHLSVGRPCGLHFRHRIPRHALRFLLRPRLRLAHGRGIGLDRCAGLAAAHAAFLLHGDFPASALSWTPERRTNRMHRTWRLRFGAMSDTTCAGSVIRVVRRHSPCKSACSSLLVLCSWQWGSRFLCSRRLYLRFASPFRSVAEELEWPHSTSPIKTPGAYTCAGRISCGSRELSRF